MSRCRQYAIVTPKKEVPMFRTALRCVALIGLVLSPGSAGAEITPAEAAPLVGEWTLTLQGDLGPGTFNVRKSRSPAARMS
jgi:hypothetical protein